MKLPPTRAVHTTSPVRASTQVATPLSPIMKRRSPTSSSDGFLGALRVSLQATCVAVTSPLPSGRTARTSPVEKPVGKKTSPCPHHRPRAGGMAGALLDAPELLARQGS